MKAAIYEVKANHLEHYVNIVDAKWDRLHSLLETPVNYLNGLDKLFDPSAFGTEFTWSPGSPITASISYMTSDMVETSFQSIFGDEFNLKSSFTRDFVETYRNRVLEKLNEGDRLNDHDLREVVHQALSELDAPSCYYLRYAPKTSHLAIYYHFHSSDPTTIRHTKFTKPSVGFIGALGVGHIDAVLEDGGTVQGTVADVVLDLIEQPYEFRKRFVGERIATVPVRLVKSETSRRIEVPSGRPGVSAVVAKESFRPIVTIENVGATTGTPCLPVDLHKVGDGIVFGDVVVKMY